MTSSTQTGLSDATYDQPPRFIRTRAARGGQRHIQALNRMDGGPSAAIAGTIHTVMTLAGLAGGVGLAAFALSFDGRALLELPPEPAQVILVLAPPVALFPVAVIGHLAASRPALRQSIMQGSLVWLLVAVLAAFWLGARPLLR